MNQIASLIQTIFSVLLSVADFLTNEGAKSIGLERFRGFGSRGGTRGCGGSPLDDPFSGKKAKRGFLDPAPRPRRMSGHSIGNNTFGSSDRAEPILDYSKLNAKDDYENSLIRQSQQAMLSGLGESVVRPSARLKHPPRLTRGQMLQFDIRKPAEHKGCTTALKRDSNYSATGSVARNVEVMKPDPNAGRRTGEGPGGITHRSVRNFIRF